MRTKLRKIPQIPEEMYALPTRKKYPIDTLEHIQNLIKYPLKATKAERDIIGQNVLRRLKELHLSPMEYIPENHILRAYIPKEDIIAQYSTFIIPYSKRELSIHNNIHYIEADNIEDAIRAIVQYAINNKMCYTRIQRWVYTTIEDKIVHIGTVFIYTYNSLEEYEYIWDENTLLGQPINYDTYKKTLDALIYEYTRKVINLGKKNNTMLISRLSYDKYLNVFMRYNERDIVANTMSLDTCMQAHHCTIDDIYVLSDLHFSGNLKHDEHIITFINDTVQVDDILFILGDIVLLPFIDKFYIISSMSKIQCKNMFLILGNHDVYTMEVLYKCGFLAIYERYTTPKYVFSHQPCNTKDPNIINFHGHLHNSGCYDKFYTNISHKVDVYYDKYEKPLTVREHLERNSMV